VVPHAGYRYSGPIAALVYDALAQERPPETVLLLGVDHHGASPGAALSDQNWLTPLGRVAVDHSFVSDLVRTPIVIDERAHAAEHSLEVQLPFLDYVLPHPKIAPLIVRFGPFDFLTEVASVVRDALRGRDALVLASTDFSHYVPAKEAERLDRMAIEQILGRNAAGLYRTVVDHEISMCGIAPTTVLLAALEGENLKASLLRWGHSGEAEKMGDVVGYASLLMESQVPI
jgi:AmmeMemoRadiSam system protein B